MEVSKLGIGFIKNWETFKSSYYICPAGELTIGYGHVVAVPHKADSDIQHMMKYLCSLPIAMTESDATILLRKDVASAEQAINENVKTFLKQNQYDALCSLIFNWGAENFIESAALRLLNNHDISDALNEMFSRDKGVVHVNGEFSQGLYNRRQAELRFWQSGAA